ncbi:MAG: hypothetical protein ABI986_13930 [Chloroflexota bacterium]
MINKENGEVTFPDWEFILSPRTTRSDFLKSSLAHKAKPEVLNEPYASWRIQASRWRDKWWTVGVRFNEERIYSIILSAWDDENGPKWENWSEAEVKKLKEYHSTVLVQILGFSPHEFSWGVVESIYDERSAGTYICVGYYEA